MPFLPALSVVFVGITGGGAGKVDHQVQTVVEAEHVERANLPIATVRTLARHGEGSQELVERMHVDGVIGGELVVDHGQLSLHLVIYNGAGKMKSYNEIAIAGRVLTKSELDVLHDNLVDEIANLGAPKVRPQPQPVIAAAGKVEAAAYKPTPKVAAKPVTKPAIADPFATAEIEMDAEQSATIAPSTRKAATETHEAAPVATADASDAVSAAELEALTSGAEVDQRGGGIVAVSAISPDALHLAAELGFGLAGRSFSPGPSTVAAYSSSPVGAIHLGAHVQPTERTRLDASLERTMSMTTALAGGSADTQMTRWEVAGAYTLVRGAVDVRARVGLGHRSFSIDSLDPARSPDGDYDYLIAGATASLPIGDRITLEGNLALEPVLWGNDSTQMSFGAASRWAVDAGIAAEVRPIHHVFIRASLDYQRFSWSWDAAGARGAGGAVDAYPSGMLSLGAQM